MKICRIVYDWPPPWGGLAPHPYEITVSQAKMGYEIHLFCGRWPKSGEIEKVEGVTIYPIWREPLKGTLEITSSIALFFKYIKWRKKNMDVDVIHSHGHFAIWIYLYRNFLQRFFPWSKELKTPLVVHFHNTVKGRWEKLKKENVNISFQSKYISWPLAELSDKTAVRVAAACIFVSKDTAEEAQKYYKLNPNRCFIVETGVNPQRFSGIGGEERIKTRSELGFDMYDKVILNYGMMVERKNVHLLVEAMTHLPEIYKLMLMGKWDPAYSYDVDELIKDKKLSGRVVKVGYTPYPQIPIALQSADMFVLPSKWEGLPKVVMESLAAGLPCLVSGFEIKEEIKGLFYLKDTNPTTIASQIKEIMEKRNVEVDVAKVIHEYSWDHKASQIEKIYEFAKKNYLL